jgi:hypothetical protein
MMEKFTVCSTCRGTGKTVNPAIDGQGLSREDFDEQGPEFEADYFGGTYDVACRECKGLRVVTRARQREFAEEVSDYRLSMAESGLRPDY